MNRIRNAWGLGIIILILVIIYALLPLGTALQFGGDEGYELMQGFLVSKDFTLYKQIWSDQPPVFALLLGWVFKIWEPSLLAARLVAASFGLILFGAFFQLVNQRSGRVTAFLATFFLLASPAVLEMSVSVMQEVPAFAIALLSVLLLFQWRKKPNFGWLIASGMIMGIALGIKLTSMLVIPAILVEIALTSQPSSNKKWFQETISNAIQWTAAAGIIFGLIGFIWGRGSALFAWKSHFVEHPVLGMLKPEDFPISGSVFFDHAECVIAAIIGFALVNQRQRWREFAFPSVLLFTSLGVHLVHRPWWEYYYLHLAIPITWFAGFAVAEAISASSKLFSKSQFSFEALKTWQAMGLCILIAMTFVRSEGRLEGSMKDLRQQERANASPVEAKMREYAGQTHWIYVPSGKETYAFNARLPMPPELAVVTLKRFWSDQISPEEIVQTCKRYRTEEVLLDAKQTGGEWKEFLNNYTLAYQDKNFALYLLKQ